jgi:hypothetical protein
MNKIQTCLLLGLTTLMIANGTRAQVYQPAPAPSAPADGISHEGPFTIKGQAGFMFGDVTYETAGIADGVAWASQLQFPLDMAVAGVDASIHWGSSMYYQQGVLGVRVMGNISDPVSEMIDRDWAPRAFLTSYTESDATLEAMMIDAYVKVPLYVGQGLFLARSTSMSLIGEYTHQEFNYDIYGLTGYYDEPGPGGYVSQYEPGSTHALTYDVTFDSVSGGAEISDSYGEAFVFTGAMLAGLAWYDGKDEHLLRSKVSTSDGVGIVFKLRGSSRYIFDAYSSGSVKWFVEGLADMTAMAMTGDQEQLFYDGSNYGPLYVDEDVTSIQVMGTVGLGCMF